MRRPGGQGRAQAPHRVPSWLTRFVAIHPAPPEVRLHADLVRLGVGSVVLVASAAVAAGGVPDWEEDLFDAIYRLPDALEPVLWVPMQLGSALAPVVLAPLAWLATRSWRPAVGAFVVGLAGWWLAKGVKAIVERGRPDTFITDLHRRRGTPTDGLGFLSGHATVAFALATVFAPYLTRRGRWLAYGLATIVGFARIHVGAHLPLDVAAGAALGTVLGALWYQAVRFRRNEAPHLAR